MRTSFPIAGVALALALAISLASAACGGQVDSGGAGASVPGEGPADSPDQDFAFCPVTEPKPSTPCSDEGNRCVYYLGRMCEGAVECRESRWQAIACIAASR